MQRQWRYKDRFLALTGKTEEKFELVESRSETLKGKLRLLKALEVTQDKQPAKSTPMAKKVLTANEIKTKIEEEIRQAQDQKSTNSTPLLINSNSTPQTEKQSYASVAISKPIQSVEKSQTQINYRNQNSTGK